MAHTVHHRLDGSKYRNEYVTGRKALSQELRLSKRVIGSVTESMRYELNCVIVQGYYTETEILQLALRDWLDKQKSVQ